MFNNLFFLLIVLAILISLFKTPFVKGLIGELIVNILTRFMLDKNTYKLLKNITLPTADGSTQIDHIIVSKYGIFVVETKNYNGWIYGDEKQKTWTQVIYKKKSKFQNPLHQNYKHIKTLEQLLNIPEENFHSVIVFMGECTFKTPMPKNIVYPLEYINFIKSKTVHILTENEVNNIVSTIEEGRFEKTIKTHITHAQHVKKIVSDKDNHCPKCGQQLILRTTKKGPNAGNQFLGCSGFPSCKYTKSID